MIIKRVKLNNIRSYIKEELNFDKGITLLSGNIGSGKSTILLAIDFALFGLRKGYLSGSALLRNGAQSGSVELTFELENKEITITRNLKRTQNSIAQDYGFLKINNENEHEFAAIELKKFIIDNLNYPKDYLTKSKYFIYNYTIYTPQEEMKQILLGEKDYRLDAIRKVFSIDKYQKIKENSKILTDFIKLKKKELSLIIDSSHEKIKEKELNEIKLLENSKKLNEIKDNLDIINKKLLEINNEIKLIENSIKDFNNIKKDFELKNLEINYKTRNIKKNENDIILLEKEISILNNDIKENLEFNQEEKLNKEIIFKKLNNDLNELKSKEKLIVIKKISSLEVIKSIEKLETCPTCRQKVLEEYKNNIKTLENNNISSLENEKVSIDLKINNLSKEISIIKEEIDNLIKKENQIEIQKLKKQNIEQKSNKLEEINKQNIELTKEIVSLTSILNKLETDLSNFSNIERIYTSSKEELNKFSQEQKNIEIKKGIIENENLILNKDIEKINKELENIVSIKNKLNNHTKLQDFLENKFISILELIEKKVLIKIKNDFDSFFQKWFYMLVDSEMIKVKLDDEFSPIIEQAGYEIEYINLSGGEKTAAALAYRLALNQIINTFVSDIKTKDILILDEPTDGFSSEQLDRLRFVLEELNINQIIIVSHENKIESFVDRIIKLQKQYHITKII